MANENPRGLPRLTRWLLNTVLIVVIVFVVLRLGPWLFDWLSRTPSDSVQDFTVFKLRKTEPDPERGLLVFVHGIGGHYRETWKGSPSGQGTGDHPYFFELCEQDKDLQSFDILLAGYPTHQTLDRAGFKAQVDHFVELLNSECPNYRRTVVVAHSMGGLIAGYGLSLSDTLNNDTHQVTLITLSTPFRGSQIASLVRTLTRAPSRQLQALEAEQDLVQLVNEYWKSYRDHHRGRLLHFAACEGIDTNGLRVVTEKSAQGPSNCICDHFELFPQDDHFTIVSPSANPWPVYATVKQWALFQGGPLVDDTLVARTSLTTLDNVVCKPGRIYEIPAGSTVNITGDALVPAGSRLVIGNGARLNWQGRGVLEIEGVVTAGSLAKDAAPVVFDFGADPAQEGGLLIHGSLVAGSTFENCQFLHGHGTRLTRANPRTADDIDWNRVAKTVTRSPDARHPVGGAVCLVSAPLVSFRNCEFKRNAANQGGALYCINAKRLVVERCKFLENISGFSGGAIFAHGSELYASDCRFANNRTGIVWSGLAPDGAPTVGNEFASGGAVYGGLDTHLEMRGCRVIGNEANYVGGGIYLLDSNSSPRAVTRESIIADSRIVGNHSLAELGGAGIYVDQTSHVALSDVQFVINTSGSASTVAGQDLLDESRYRADAPDLSGVKFADNVLFFDPKLRNRKDAIPSLISGVLNVLQPASAGKEVFSTVAQPVDFGELRFARQRTTRAQVLGEPAVVAAKVLPSNCFEVQTTERSVDVIVVHHTSAIKWESLRKEFPDQVREFETRQGQMPPEARKYDWRHCLRIFELYGVSAHYLIDRNGVIRQLVDENDVAYHAGVSKMPPPDGRERVNDFSIGIELIASHPEDDPAVSRSTAYTPRQYQSLHWLLRDICLRRPAISVENILGHEDIAPGRKKDPGPHFDWPRVRQDLSDDLDAFSRMSMAH